MKPSVHSGWEHETLEAKAAWFAGLSMAERLAVLDDFYRLAVAMNPGLRRGRDVRESGAAVRVIDLP